MVASRVWWRRGAVASSYQQMEAVVQSLDKLIEAKRAEADRLSSIANGIPSRRPASFTTAAWLPGVTSNAAPASRARSTSKAIASH